jgi:hypothetical protein
LVVKAVKTTTNTLKNVTKIETCSYGNASQSISVKRIKAYGSHTVWNSYSGQLVVLKRSIANGGNAVADDHTGQLAVSKSIAFDGSDKLLIYAA